MAPVMMEMEGVAVVALYLTAVTLKRTVSSESTQKKVPCLGVGSISTGFVLGVHAPALPPTHPPTTTTTKNKINITHSCCRDPRAVAGHDRTGAGRARGVARAHGVCISTAQGTRSVHPRAVSDLCRYPLPPPLMNPLRDLGGRCVLDGCKDPNHKVDGRARDRVHDRHLRAPQTRRHRRLGRIPRKVPTPVPPPPHAPRKRG